MNLDTLKKDFSKVETYVKTGAVAAVTGGAGVAYQLLSSVGHESDLFTPEGILKLKHTFLYGAAVSVIGLFMKTPLTSSSKS
jgi:hypothetical protein